MSVETDILSAIKSYVEAWRSNRLSAHVFIGQYLDEYSKLPEWVRISTESSRSELIAISTINRAVSVRIGYYRKSDGAQSYELSSDLKDYLLTKIPLHSGYWQEWTMIYDDNVTDLEDEGYEGFGLVLEFYRAQSVTCDAIDSDSVYLVTASGEELTTENELILITG